MHSWQNCAADIAAEKVPNDTLAVSRSCPQSSANLIDSLKVFCNRSSTNFASKIHALVIGVSEMLRGRVGHRVEIASSRSSGNAAIGEGCDHGAIGCVEAYDDVPVTGQVFRKRCEIGAQSSAPGTQDDDRIHCLVARDIRVGPAVRLDTSEIARQQFAEDKALMLFQRTSPICGKVC